MILVLREGVSLSTPEIITLVLGLAISLALMLVGWFSVSISSDLDCFTLYVQKVVFCNIRLCVNLVF